MHGLPLRLRINRRGIAFRLYGFMLVHKHFIASGRSVDAALERCTETLDHSLECFQQVEMSDHSYGRIEDLSGINVSQQQQCFGGPGYNEVFLASPSASCPQLEEDYLTAKAASATYSTAFPLQNLTVLRATRAPTPPEWASTPKGSLITVGGAFKDSPTSLSLFARGRDCELMQNFAAPGSFFRSQLTTSICQAHYLFLGGDRSD